MNIPSMLEYHGILMLKTVSYSLIENGSHTCDIAYLLRVKRLQNFVNVYTEGYKRNAPV